MPNIIIKEINGMLRQKIKGETIDSFFIIHTFIHMWIHFWGNLCLLPPRDYRFLTRVSSRVMMVERPLRERKEHMQMQLQEQKGESEAGMDREDAQEGESRGDGQGGKSYWP
jgi:hypothetical protein